MHTHDSLPTIVVTRDADDALVRSIADQLSGRAHVTGAAVTQIVSLVDTHTATALGVDSDWLIITSKNTVRIIEQSATLPSIADLCRGKAVCAVGQGSADALVEHGCHVTWVADGSAAAIVRDWHTRPTVDEDSPTTVLVPCSALAKPTLRTGLAGCQVTEVPIYTTTAVDQLPPLYSDDNPPDVIVALAGSSVKALADYLRRHPDIKLVTIGKPSAKVARDLGLHVSAVAATPDASGLATAVVTI